MIHLKFFLDKPVKKYTLWCTILAVGVAYN
jgi:hypothetical protein